VAEESRAPLSTRMRTAVFLSGMRHHAAALQSRGVRLWYVTLDEQANSHRIETELRRAIETLQPGSLLIGAPGDWRLWQQIRALAKAASLPLTVVEGRHFFSTAQQFAQHARGRKQLRMEYWYRAMRQRTGVLMNGDQPKGGQWNFDHDNRSAFGRDGPGRLPAPLDFEPDDITREVIGLVNERLTDLPGEVTAGTFRWPMTRAQALEALADFIDHRLPKFGQWQDAMWEGEPWLYHAQLSQAMNLQLLSAAEVVAAAEQAFNEDRAPLAAVEGFVRQILGWREYVRGIYWTQMPGYADRNALDAREPLPDFYWHGDTEMACLRDVVTQTLRLGYAHHIQRLMVTGLYALLLGVEPQQVHAWYLAVYVDAVEWVELPNTLGMSQYGDGGLMASKPYAATGKYIQRMSNHCAGCRYDPAKRTGDDACPYTLLYWDFLMRHEEVLSQNQRMALQVRNVSRIPADEQEAIRDQADAWRRQSRERTAAWARRRRDDQGRDQGSD